jgi:cytoskeletal protein CcmA (bactofilin family)
MGTKKVIISGSEHFAEIQCEHLIVPGSGTIDGDVDASTVDVTGTLVVEGKLESSNITASGSLRVNSGIITDNATITGYIYAKGENKFGNLAISGHGEIHNVAIEEYYGEAWSGNCITADLIELTE